MGRAWSAVKGFFALAGFIVSVLTIIALLGWGTVGYPIVIDMRPAQSGATTATITTTVVSTSTTTSVQTLIQPAPYPNAINVPGKVSGSWINGIKFTAAGGQPQLANYHNGQYWILLSNNQNYTVDGTWSLLFIGGDTAKCGSFRLQVGSDSLMPPLNWDC